MHFESPNSRRATIEDRVPEGLFRNYRFLFLSFAAELLCAAEKRSETTMHESAHYAALSVCRTGLVAAAIIEHFSTFPGKAGF
jgi:hypothetical protein